MITTALSLFPQPSEIAAAGFLHVGSTNTLYSHPKFPGVLFKRTRDLASAMACGGIVVASPTLAIMYVGASMQLAYHNDLIGSITVPATSGVYEFGQEVGQWTSYTHPAKGISYVAESYRHQSLLSAGLLLGVVTRASDGHAVASSTGASAYTFTAPRTAGLPSAVYSQASFYAEWTLVNAVDLTGAILSQTGFMAHKGFVPFKAFISAGAQAMIDSVDDGDIQTLYAQAVGEKLALIDPLLTVETDVKVHLGPNGWGSETVLSRVTPAPQNGPTARKGSYGDGPVPGGTHSTRTVSLASNAQVSVSHLPLLEFTCQLGGTDMISTNPLRAASQINMASVVQTKCKLSNAQAAVPIAAVLPSIFVLSAPSPYPEDVTLDFTSYSVAEFAKVSFPVGTDFSFSGADAAAVNNRIAAGDMKADDEKTQRRAIGRRMGVKTRLVCDFVEAVDDRVRDLVGES